MINNRSDGEGGPDQPSNASIQADGRKAGAELIYIFPMFQVHLLLHKFKR
ncbi:beta-lactamase hydrolase domain-containing protein [Polynucleobacter necessarius]|nr:sulfur transferase domain-containing protein [Polynucleobacter necessarius]